MKEVFTKFFDGVKKVDKFADENRQAKIKTPLWVMILNDCLPILTVIAYILMGTIANLWHPGWLIFFFIPIYYMFVECVKHKNAYVFPYPLLVVTAYLLVGFLMKIWHPTWLLFVSIPFYYGVVVMIKTRNINSLFNIIMPILVVAAYLGLGFGLHAWHPGWVVFFAIPVYYQIVATVSKYKKIHKGENDDDKHDDSNDSDQIIIN